MKNLVIQNLHASTIDGLEILKGIDLVVKEGDIVALLGPNGHGKSTLINVIMGNPNYEVTEGSITYNNEDLLALSVDERAKLGIFLGMQNPVEIPGVINSDFLKSALNSRLEKPLSFYQFYKIVNQASEDLKMPLDMMSRSLNDGFSGGEKKRNEILQMKVLNPSLVMLDEIDSGLDVDAINLVSNEINKQKDKSDMFIVISHYARMLDLVKPSRSVVIINGKVIVDGDESIYKKIDAEGYEWIEKQYGVSTKKEITKRNVILGSCAVKEVIKK